MKKLCLSFGTPMMLLAELKPLNSHAAVGKQSHGHRFYVFELLVVLVRQKIDQNAERVQKTDFCLSVARSELFGKNDLRLFQYLYVIDGRGEGKVQFFCNLCHRHRFIHQKAYDFQPFRNGKGAADVVDLIEIFTVAEIQFIEYFLRFIHVYSPLTHQGNVHIFSALRKSECYANSIRQTNCFVNILFRTTAKFM